MTDPRICGTVSQRYRNVELACELVAQNRGMAASAFGKLEYLSPFKSSWSSSLTRKGTLRFTLNIVGGILVVLGCIWFLQGINVLPGSFMTGQSHAPVPLVCPTRW